MRINRDANVLVMGQHLTSRTEALRDFLLPRVNNLCVIGLVSPSLQRLENHFFSYENNCLKRHIVFSHPLISRVNIYSLRILLTFLSYQCDIARSIILIRRKYDLSVGIARFSGFTAACFKLFRISKKCIYYSIDYYYHFRKPGLFNNVFLFISDLAEKFAIYISDEVWDITDRISIARSIIRKIKKQSYAHKYSVVPLGYSNAFFRNKDLAPSEKYTLVFAGVVVEGQGLELLLDILPELKKDFPALKVKIIGTGPFLPRFKEKLKERNADGFFSFYGFIEDVDRMIDVISSSAVGVSLWNEKTNGTNFYFGDPGKTKLYSVCGLPVIVSNKTVYAKVISNNRCGIAIRYKHQELLDAIRILFLDNAQYKEYKSNTIKTARDYCSAEKIFSQVLHSQ
jgi:glycosyltransferase involved in cell wall biosynthesis